MEQNKWKSIESSQEIEEVACPKGSKRWASHHSNELTQKENTNQAQWYYVFSFPFSDCGVSYQLRRIECKHDKDQQRWE